MRFFRLASFALLLATPLAGCSSEKEATSDVTPLALEEGCQPLLGGYDCHLPYPSDFFRVADSSAPYGHRFEARGAGRFVSASGLDAEVGETKAFDGASLIPSIVALLPSEVTDEGFPGLLDREDRSTSLESATLIVNAETGELVPHYADLDGRAKDRTRQGIVLHPLVSLSPSTRYVVALRNVKQPDGTLAPAAEGFRRLRDGVSGDPELASLSARWEVDVMAPLDALGVTRSEVQLAWDFTTTTGEMARDDMLRVRELTMAWLEANTPEVSIESVTDNESGKIFRVIKGTLKGPMFLTEDAPGSELHRDGEGKVAQNGVVSFPFTIQVPFSVHEQEGPGRALGYGHGFFGSQEEAEGDLAKTIASNVHAVTFAIDWWGMSRADLGSVVGKITDAPAHTASFTDRVHQAMANWMTMTTAIRTVLPTVSELRRGDEEAYYDPSEVFFFGASQGHILGGTLAALDPNLSRVVLNVGGAGLSHVMFRSRAFAPFLAVINVSFPNELDHQKFAAMLQVPFDRIDPATYAPLVLSHPLPGSHPDRRVLVQIGLGDVQVPNLGSFLHTRLLGIGQLTPNPHPIFGVPQVEAPQTSAASVFDFGIDLEQVYSKAAPAKAGNSVHDGLRVAEPALLQMDRFFEDGTIVHPCDGPCVIE